MLKPRVCYIDAAYPPTVGRSATVFTVDHPRLNGWVCTSKVLVIAGKQFETLNTIYYQAETDESRPYTSEKDIAQPTPRHDFDVDWCSFVGAEAREHAGRSAGTFDQAGILHG
jgi:hypothetical protein